MNIVLIGYRGTGKSCVATILGQRLGWRVVSTDAEIVARAGRSIPEIVEQQGWDHFRALETEVCRDLAALGSVVIDTGGGAILRQENVTALKTDGTLLWLTAEVSTIARRISGNTQRPSLTGGKSFVDEIAEVLQARLPAYQGAADHVVPTDQHTAEQIAEQIIALLEA